MIEPKPQTRRCASGRLAIALLALLPTGCDIFFLGTPANPLIGTWTTADNNRVAFQSDAVIVTPDKGKPTTMGNAECTGVYKLAYGRMETAPLKQLFPSQA